MRTLTTLRRQNARLNGLHLGAQQSERVQVGHRNSLCGKFFVGFSEFVLAVSVSAVAPVLTRLLLLEVLANLRLVVVVWNVKHFVLDFHGELLSEAHAKSRGSEKHIYRRQKGTKATR